MTIEFDFDTPVVEDRRDKGYICQCCNLFVKRYKRSINSNMALALLTLYKSGVMDFVHLENLMQSKGYKRCGDASYLIHWRLLERCKEKREDNSSRNGKYKITSAGIMFCEQKIKVKQGIYIFNNTYEGFWGEDISIQDALGEKFSYENLMKSE